MDAFLEGRRLHLMNKRQVVLRRLGDPLPEPHRVWKVRTLLPAIDAAIERIDTMNYGECVTCGDPIPRARLELLPEVTRCVPCGEQEERRGH